MDRDFQQVYIRRELQVKIKALAALNDIRISDLASEMIRDILEDKERTNQIVNKLRRG